MRNVILGAAAIFIALIAARVPAHAKDDSGVSMQVHAGQTGPVISRNLFGQFAEQLGRGIDDGVWVGPDSDIPNVRGIRSDVVQALRALKVPNVRWPGGCFADQYNWRDGIGPRAKRPVRYNIHWGSPVETNQFGTHEYMDFIEQIGSEAHIVGNVGTGSAREAARWLEYMTTDKPTTLAKERAANGRKEPWRVKYFAYGNESYGCGGPMRAETYLERLRIHGLNARNLNPAQSGPLARFMKGPDPMVRLAVGPAHDKTDYTKVLMEAWAETGASAAGDRMFDALSFHYYTAGRIGVMRDKAVGFEEADYAAFVKNAYAIDGMIAQQSAIMDQYDPGKHVALSVDEWGTWVESTPGSAPLFLEQQGTMRDAIIAAVHLNIFTRRADRVRMASIAQMVNVLQAVIQTDGRKMLLTPTYHVFRMYVPFQDATRVPVTVVAGEYRHGDTVLPRVDAIAARDKDGKLWLAMTNIDPNTTANFSVTLDGTQGSRAVGETLTAPEFDAVNTYDAPDTVRPVPVSFEATGNTLSVTLPPHAISVVKVLE